MFPSHVPRKLCHCSDPHSTRQGQRVVRQLSHRVLGDGRQSFKELCLVSRSADLLRVQFGWYRQTIEKFKPRTWSSSSKNPYTRTAATRKLYVSSLTSFSVTLWRFQRCQPITRRLLGHRLREMFLVVSEETKKRRKFWRWPSLTTFTVARAT